MGGRKRGLKSGTGRPTCDACSRYSPMPKRNRNESEVMPEALSMLIAEPHPSLRESRIARDPFVRDDPSSRGQRSLARTSSTDAALYSPSREPPHHATAN